MHSIVGYTFRGVSIILVVVSYVFFYLVEKKNIHKFDVIVTYTLLVGAMCLDAIALLMLVFSDWTISAINANKPMGTKLRRLPIYIFALRD